MPRRSIRGVRGHIWRRRTRRIQRGSLPHGAVAIHAANFNRSAHLAIEFRIAVRVLLKVTIDAVHALFQVNVHHVNRHAIFSPALRIHGLLQSFVGHFGDFATAAIEQFSVIVLLEHGPKYPAVTMEIGKLRVPQLAVQLRNSRQKFRIGPQSSSSRFLGIRHLRLHHLLGRGVSLFGRYMNSPSVSLSHHMKPT